MRNLRKTRLQIEQHAGTLRGFSLLELIIVLAVAMMLTSLLLPAMRALRENVNRVVCSSNMRQIGMGVSMYASSRNDWMPHTAMLDNGKWKPNELMGAHHGSSTGWDGLGWLFVAEYCGSFECFYCPSHKGSHPVHRYAESWPQQSGPIYTNYHYAGHRNWVTKNSQVYVKNETLVLLTDGMRTASDFNHKTGMNVLHGDISVRWRPDLVKILDLLPESEGQGGVEERFKWIWGQIQSLISPPQDQFDQAGF